MNTAGLHTAAAAAIPAVWRIVVVDDNADAALTLAMLLELAGHRTRCAHRGDEALRVAAEFDADAVVLDIGLPDLDGHAVAARLRERGPRVPVLVALSGRDGDADDRGAFDAWLVKPADADVLLQHVARAFAARAAAAR